MVAICLYCRCDQLVRQGCLHMLFYHPIVTIFSLFHIPQHTASALQAAPKRAKNAVKSKEQSYKELIIGEVGTFMLFFVWFCA